MKSFVFIYVAVHVILVQCKKYPAFLPHPCRKSSENYQECAKEILQTLVPYLAEGVPELNVPPLDPLIIPEFSTNSNIEFISTKLQATDLRVLGMNNTIINSLRVGPKYRAAEVTYTWPYLYFTMVYNVSGHVLGVPTNNYGYLKGNFTDTVTTLNLSLRPIKKDSKKYFALKTLAVKSRVGDGYVEMIAKDPRQQAAADIISSFYNENARAFMDVINPIYVAAFRDAAAMYIEKVLSVLPADELLPE